MSNLIDWIAAMFGRAAPTDVQERIKLDVAEGQMAGRLSRLTGKRRDEVFAESYRRADKILSRKR